MPWTQDRQQRYPPGCRKIGLHTKLENTPRNYNDVQRFAGLVNYISNFLPNVTAYTGPLMSMTQNGALFFWRPIHDKCFEMIKAICCKTPVIKPLDCKSDKPIWVISDTSKTGVGAMYGQGDNWMTCRPAGFMLKTRGDRDVVP
jgi:hypothetical protein